MKNLHLFYNKTMYDGLGYYEYDERKKIFVYDKQGGYIRDNKNGKLFTTSLDPKNGEFKQMFEEKFDNNEDYIPSDVAAQTIILKTTYPGLLAGSGYAHGISDNNDAKIGFTFDYVTGQPIIPGSSVKGIIRSAFNHPEIIREELNQMFEKEDIEALKKDIFENRDIFFDAVVRYVPCDKPLLGTDYITPHSSPIKNPVPVKFVKVMPGVFLEFRFKLFDTKIILKNGTEFTLTSAQKETLFKAILLLLGVGAKTNIGYGNLAEPDEKEKAGLTNELVLYRR